MIRKISYFFIFLTLAASIPFQASYSPQTPHGSNHSDETRSSDLNPSQSTVLQSRHTSSRSSSQSPEPENPNVENPKKPFFLESIEKAIAIAQKNNDESLENMSSILDRSSRQLGQDAYHAFYRPEMKPCEPLSSKIVRMLYQLGLRESISVTLTEDPAEGSCKHSPYLIMINKHWFASLSEIDQKITLSYIVANLNNCEIGLNQIISAEKNSINQERLQNHFEILQENNRFIAMLTLLKKATKAGNDNEINTLTKMLEKEYSDQILPGTPSPAPAAITTRQLLAGKRDRERRDQE